MDTTRFKVEDLREGDEYEFRVVAYNEAGASRPSTTAGPIVIQDQNCKIGTRLMSVSESSFIKCVIVVSCRCSIYRAEGIHGGRAGF